MPELNLNYPSGLDTEITLLNVANNAITKLSDPIGGSTNVIPVLSTELFPTSGLISINSEIIAYYGKTVNTFTGCVRGIDNTVAVAHDDEASVEGRFVAAHHKILVDAILSLQNKLGVGSSSPEDGNFLKGSAAGTTVWENISPDDVNGLVEFIQDSIAGFLVSGTGIQFSYNDELNTFTVLNSSPLTSEQVQDIVGAMVTNGTNVSSSYNDTTGTLTINAIGDGTGLTTENVQDIVGSLLKQGTNITLNYNDATGELSISAVASNLGDMTKIVYDSNNDGKVNAADSADTVPAAGVSNLTEFIQDAVASFLVSGTGIQFTCDDNNNTFTVVNSSPLTTEQVQDILGAMIVNGSNITSTYDDTTGILTINSIGDGTGFTTEQAQDIVASLLVQGSNVNLTYNDNLGTITVGVTNTLSRNIVTATTSNIANNAVENLTVNLGKLSTLINIATSVPAEIRIYPTAESRTADASRPSITVPNPESGLLYQGTTTAELLSIICSPTVSLFNLDEPVNFNIYMSIKNLSGNASVVSITLTKLTVEN